MPADGVIDVHYSACIHLEEVMGEPAELEFEVSESGELLGNVSFGSLDCDES